MEAERQSPAGVGKWRAVRASPHSGLQRSPPGCPQPSGPHQLPPRFTPSEACPFVSARVALHSLTRETALGACGCSPGIPGSTPVALSGPTAQERQGWNSYSGLWIPKATMLSHHQACLLVLSIPEAETLSCVQCHLAGKDGIYPRPRGSLDTTWKPRAFLLSDSFSFPSS